MELEYPLSTFNRSNQDTSLVHRPAVFPGQWVQGGDLLADCSTSVGGEISLGQNILIAYMPWEGYNFEDAILVSERLVYDDLYTSVHIEKYELDIMNANIDMEEITRVIPNVTEKDIENLDESGIIKLGSWVKEGDILIGKVKPLSKDLDSNFRKFINLILEKPNIPGSDTSLRASKGVHAKVIEIKLFKDEAFIDMQEDITKVDSLSSKDQPKLKKSPKSAIKNKNKKNVSLFPLLYKAHSPGSKQIQKWTVKKQVLKLRNQKILNLNPTTMEMSFPAGFKTGPFLKLKTLRLMNSLNKIQWDTFFNSTKLSPIHPFYDGVTKMEGNPTTLKALKTLLWETGEVERKEEKRWANQKRNRSFSFFDPRDSKNQASTLRKDFKKQSSYFLDPNPEFDSEFDSDFDSDSTNKSVITLHNEFDSKTPELTDILWVRLYLADKRRIQVGDKMAGRHGNKGIISQILPPEDMPFLPDGTALDMVLNPLGVPSRMNVGQIYECLLGLAGKHLGENYKIFPFDEIYGAEASRSFVYSKLYEARVKTGKRWLFNPNCPGKLRLYDGRTGESFDQTVTVGYAYMLRLVHMVDDKIHARSTGPYALVTQQPVRGRSKQGGQRLGEMEVWALEGYGAAFVLLEMLTLKSDDLTGRMGLWSNIILNKDLSIGTPESFRVLIGELRALCLDVGLFNPNLSYFPAMAKIQANLKKKKEEAAKDLQKLKEAEIKKIEEEKQKVEMKLQLQNEKVRAEKEKRLEAVRIEKERGEAVKKEYKRITEAFNDLYKTDEQKKKEAIQRKKDEEKAEKKRVEAEKGRIKAEKLRDEAEKRRVEAKQLKEKQEKEEAAKIRKAIQKKKDEERAFKLLKKTAFGLIKDNEAEKLRVEAQKQRIEAILLEKKQEKEEAASIRKAIQKEKNERRTPRRIWSKNEPLV